MCRAYTSNLRRQLLLGSLAASLAGSLPGLAQGVESSVAATEGSQQSLSRCLPSPVDLPPFSLPPPAPDGGEAAALQPIKFKYPRYVKGTVINSGQGTPQVLMPDNVTFQMGSDSFKLLEFHFTAPSEHAMAGKHAALEAQLVHRNTQTGELCVLCVLLEAGGSSPNPCLATALRSCPALLGAEAPMDKPISLLTLLPSPRTLDGRRPYATYMGTAGSLGSSRTRPPQGQGQQQQGPCGGGEAARWVVFLDPVQVPASQVLEVLYFAGNGRTMELNARPEQPLGGRDVRFFI
ncbi:hypothetical protein N2152v2_007640 [Parachlorella kessleri]